MDEVKNGISFPSKIMMVGFGVMALAAALIDPMVKESLKIEFWGCFAIFHIYAVHYLEAK